ncbi:glycosyltransferase [bacterium]|nr:MAG: glycosyltransferase [bacterium]
MEILYENKTGVRPKLSIILLDWSCRESFHIFKYLSEQTAAREDYEVLWVEYYGARPPDIRQEIDRSLKNGQRPPIDKWIVLDIPKNIYYHKHLMFNVGIIAATGRIVMLCDSDAILRPTFVQSVINAFEKEDGIVVHVDEVRNVDSRFHPFNYPSIDDILGQGCINWKDGLTTGLTDREDPLHTLNYGACMAALKDDMIAVGGADEHIDYLGHICGPYEMTFRLVNAGKREVWLRDEFIYHVWHPGTDGVNNHMGPHDGRNVSTTALSIKRTGRTMPLVENQAIGKLRLKQDDVIYEPLVNQAIPTEVFKDWAVEKFAEKNGLEKRKGILWWVNGFKKHPFVNAWLVATFFKILVKQFHMKLTKFTRKSYSGRELLKKVYRSYDFFKKMGQYNSYTFQRCGVCLKELASENTGSIALYGTGEVAEIIYKMSLCEPVKVSAVFDGFASGSFFDVKVLPFENIRYYNGKILIASLIGVDDKVEALKKIGVSKERIVVL